MSITIASRKAKARKLQQWVCKKIAEVFNIEFNNQDEQCLIHSREMGQKGVDVILRGRIYELFKFDIECKATETFNCYKDINQAKQNTKENREWLLIHKRKNNKPIVVLDAEAFFNIIKELKLNLYIKE